jgi:hypothetical protein
MSANELVLNALHQRISTLEKILELRGQQIETLGQVVTDLVESLRGVGQALDERTMQIFKVAAMALHIGQALTAEGVLSPEWPRLIRKVMQEELEPDATEGTRALVKLLDYWADQPPPIGDQHKPSDRKARLTLVADNDRAAGAGA